MLFISHRTKSSESIELTYLQRYFQLHVFFFDDCTSPGTQMGSFWDAPFIFPDMGSRISNQIDSVTSMFLCKNCIHEKSEESLIC